MKRFEEYTSVKQLQKQTTPKRLMKLLLISGLFTIVILFLPWTQTVRSRGNVTTINATIGGRIDKWFVKEGDFVEQGDTLVYLTEIKSEYMDPELLNRTASQIKSKENSSLSYMNKVRSLDQQIDALIDNRKIKLQQALNEIKQTRLKIISDSMDFVATDKQLDIAVKQYNRTEELKEQGLKSQTDVENKRLKVQEMEAKVVSLENKLLTSRNELLNKQANINSIDADFRDKIAKSESEKASAMSNLYDVEATVSKMQNEAANYTLRSGYYFITAPQAGFISQIFKNGIGEIIKEEMPLVSIVPNLSDYAVETFVTPMDLPLLHVGNSVRLQFDGWPAIVFSGWPNVSHGTYGGTISAIDNYISENGKYRILIKPDPKDYTWPIGLRMGVAVETMAILKDVPIWYELWRKINGFPPEYYTVKSKETDKTKK
jgi:multidrug resistance efflux pump